MADTNLLILAREFKDLRNRVQEVLKMPVGPQGLQGDKGEQGVKGETGAPGKNGKDGKDGVNGLNGTNGINGTDGVDGADGLDGVGVQNAYIDFDNSLVIVLTSGQEINAGFLSQETKESVVATFKQGAQTINELLPVQTGNENKVLTTDGTNVFWNTPSGGTETDPVYASSSWYTTTNNSANWDTAYGWGNHASAGYLTSYTETDPIVGAVNGLVKANGAGTISAAVAGIDYLAPAAIGTTVQAYDVDLTAWAGVATSAKQDTLVSGTNIKTINGSSLLGSGDLAISGGGGASALTISNKTAAYTVVAGDLGTIIRCTSGTFSVSLTAAATLGIGFNVQIISTGATVTISPAAGDYVSSFSSASFVLREGEGLRLVVSGALTWETIGSNDSNYYSENRTLKALRTTASGLTSVAIGYGSTASGSSSHVFGRGTTASSDASSAIGLNSSFTGSQAVTGSGAMALGGSRASGTDSFAAAVANNTSSYGAQAANSISIGQLSKATGANSVALGTESIASGGFSTVLNGTGANDGGIWGKFVIGSGFNAAGQTGITHLRMLTTNATATLMSANGGAAGTTNQVILPNNSAYAFTGTVVARRQAAGGTESAAWKIEGLIRREGTAASTTLVASTVTAISNTPGWTLALSADTANGGLAVTVTGVAATNIKWLATIQTSEVTYA